MAARAKAREGEADLPLLACRVQINITALLDSVNIDVRFAIGRTFRRDPSDGVAAELHRDIRHMRARPTVRPAAGVAVALASPKMILHLDGSIFGRIRTANERVG